jgi:tyrosyl-tRNA synthetase
LYDDLKWRGLIAHSTDPDALKQALDTTKISSYVGFDPSAPSLHMGNLLQLITARRLQAAGHTPYLLVGGSTGLIGDPRMTSERNLNPKEIVDGWVERIRSQVARFIDFDGPNGGHVVNNYEWTKDVPVLDFLRDIGKHFSVSRMLAREVVKSRLEEVAHVEARRARVAAQIEAEPGVVEGRLQGVGVGGVGDQAAPG